MPVIKEMELTIEEKKLLETLTSLHHKLRDDRRQRYNRVNPFMENLFNWQEKALYCKSKNSTIYDSVTVIGDVSLGENLWVGYGCLLDGSGGLSIGDGCNISFGVKILSHDTVKRCLTSGEDAVEYAPVSIGKNCFIGTDAVILKGVSLGDNCVVCAKSLVNKSYPPKSIIGGVPARVLGQVDMKDDYSDVSLFFYEKEKSNMKPSSDDSFVFTEEKLRDIITSAWMVGWMQKKQITDEDKKSYANIVVNKLKGSLKGGE